MFLLFQKKRWVEIIQKLQASKYKLTLMFTLFARGLAIDEGLTLVASETTSEVSRSDVFLLSLGCRVLCARWHRFFFPPPFFRILPIRLIRHDREVVYDYGARPFFQTVILLQGRDFFFIFPSESFLLSRLGSKFIFWIGRCSILFFEITRSILLFDVPWNFFFRLDRNHVIYVI